MNDMDFLKKCSESIGNFESDMFGVGVVTFLDHHGSTSPIEKIFYTAVRTIQKINSIDDWAWATPDESSIKIGLEILPQFSIGHYRVDFLVRMHPTPNQDGSQQIKEVIIECDSQEFHERSEKERRYEKKRDRFFQINGYKVFHFTGSEIVREPFRVAGEALSFVTGFTQNALVDENYLAHEFLDLPE